MIAMLVIRTFHSARDGNEMLASEPFGPMPIWMHAHGRRFIKMQPLGLA